MEIVLRHFLTIISQKNPSKVRVSNVANFSRTARVDSVYNHHGVNYWGLGSNPSDDSLLLKKSSVLRTTLAISKTLFPS